MLLLLLLLGVHEGSNDIQVRLLLELELLSHSNIPVPTGFAGQLAYKSLEHGGMVEDLKLVHISQVAVDCAPTSMKLLKLGSLCGGTLAALEVMEVVHMVRGQLAVLALLVI